MRHEKGRTFQTKAAKISRRRSEKSGRQSSKLRAVGVFLGRGGHLLLWELLAI